MSEYIRREIKDALLENSGYGQGFEEKIRHFFLFMEKATFSCLFLFSLEPYAQLSKKTIHY
ncbi:hypothetical protein A946_00490 [Methylacidiphilum kamchatkense Kam1]|uniref:Uncharacterized protein n=1 Tax=Methylacidiphilum kamchatkense Kam1 TaxID=1202785 RepID=A0ABR4ZYM9_9BACT|nr:hypothetical protein A946_00490 [Methylacidiphilum kamchatkense Kam1]